MKRVSFKVAKALKKAGYPQGTSKYLYDIDGTFASKYDYEQWNINTLTKIDMPTYLEAWLWLWREGKFKIDLDECFGVCMIYDTTILDYRRNGDIYEFKYTDPEEAIEKAIVYLVDNNLIK